MNVNASQPAELDTLVGHFEKHSRTLLGVAARGLGLRVRARVDAADVVQEALLEALRRRAERPTTQSKAAWLSFLTKEAALHVRRRHVRAACRSTQLELTGIDARGESLRGKEVNAVSAAAGEATGSLAMEDLARLRGLLLELKPVDRHIVVLHYWRGLGFAEIAASTGGTADSCRKRCARALEMLRARSADGKGQPRIG